MAVQMGLHRKSGGTGREHDGAVSLSRASSNLLCFVDLTAQTVAS